MKNHPLRSYLALGVFTVLALSSCNVLTEIAQNLPNAETPTLDAVNSVESATLAVPGQPENAPGSGVLHLSALNPLPTQPTGNYRLPTGETILLAIKNRSFTNVAVSVNGVSLRVPEHETNERFLRQGGIGFYFVNKTGNESQDQYLAQQIAIILPAAFNSVRPLTVEIFGVSMRNDATGLDKTSAPLVVIFEPEPNFTVSLAAPATVHPGDSTPALAIGVQRNVTANFDVNLTFAVTPATAGVSGQLSASVVPYGQSAATVTVATTATTTTGNYALTVTGKDPSGVIRRTASSTLQVTALPANNGGNNNGGNNNGGNNNGGNNTNNPGHGVDCGCSGTGIYVSPADLTESVSNATLTVIPSSGGGITATFQVQETNGTHIINHQISNGTTATPGFSPHGKYFVVAEKNSQNRVRILVYDLTTWSNSAFVAHEFQPYNVPVDGWDNAGWGFGPDAKDRSLLIAKSVDAQKTELSLVNLALQQRSIIENFTADATWFFSPCGDMVVTKKITGSAGNTLTFQWFRTRDGMFATAASVPISTTYRDAMPWVVAQGSSTATVLRKTKLDDITTEDEAVNNLPSAATPCP